MSSPTPGPLQATDTSALGAATSGLYRFEVDTSNSGSSPTWTEAKGVTKLSPKFEQVTEDDTDLSSGGWASEYPVGNGFTIDIEGLTKGVAGEDGIVVDPGVQALLDASATFGAAGIIHGRYWRTDNLPEAYEFYATCKVSRAGDKPPALDKWSGTLTGKNAPLVIAKPTEEDETP